MSDYEVLESVKAFRALQAAIETQSQMILKDAQDDREASSGMLFLLRSLAMSSELIADANPRAPHFARMDTPGRKVGGDNPDAEYDVLTLDGHYGYRVTGNVGTVRHLSFTFNAGDSSGRRRTFEYFNREKMEIDASGSFTLLLAPKKPNEPGTWVEVPEEPYSVLVRQFIANREEEVLATYEIAVMGERADEIALLTPTDAEIGKALTATGHVFSFLTSLHHVAFPELFETPHKFVRANSDDLGADISGTDNLYMFSTFDMSTDEALIIELEPLEVSYWNISVMSRFHESVDYMKRPTSRTLDEVTTDPDGRIRLVVTNGLPIHPNWLDTAGHRYGVIVFRWVGPRDAVTELPTATLVNVQELDSTLAKQQGNR